MKRRAGCGIQAGFVCWEVIRPDGRRVKESVVTCNSSMTSVWGFKIHMPGSWSEPTATLTSLWTSPPQWETDCLFNYCFMEYLVTGSP